MADLDKARKAYAFFTDCYITGNEFSIAELTAATGWTGTTPQTYVSKKWKDFLERVRPGTYRVKLEFRRLSEDEFLAHFSQKTPIFGRYRRLRFESLIRYEFLLPLARQQELRSILDELFYADSIRNRVREIGLDEVHQWMPRHEDEADEQFIDRLVLYLGNIFFGYSVSHVEGRFRGGDLMSRAEAAEVLERYGRYLIDETTAVVLFIIRLPSSRAPSFIAPGPNAELSEIEGVRRMFIALFAEALVRTVKQEDEIWLLEESPYGHKLFVWERDIA